MSYESDIVVGEHYRDPQTGYEGVVTSVTFYQYACERIGLESYDAERKEVKTEIFDAPRLVSVATGERATTSRTGGPGDINAQHRPGSR
jgi:hypothetical protein